MGIARRRMRRRVLVAGAATGAVAYHAGKKHQQNQQDQQDQYDDQQEPEQTDYAPAPPPADSGPDASDLDQIAKLADLHKSGALTDEEFAVAKSKLLA